jgi:hypothetical protein
VAEAHLDHPGEIHWFKGEGPAPVVGPCPHSSCKHLGQGVIAWGPSLERYELVQCGSIRPADEADDDCASRCRAWIDGRGRVTTAWLMVDLGRESDDFTDR